MTPIYKHFLENNGRFQHKDDAIYSETELKYLHSSLSKMRTQDNTLEFNELEGQAIVNKHK